MRIPRGIPVLRWTAAALAIAALGTGCAPSGYYRSTQSSLDSLLATQAQLQKRIATLEQRIEVTRESVQATRASADSRLSDLSQRMDMMQGKLEESGVRFTKLSQRIESMKAQQRAPNDTSHTDATGGVDPETAYQAAYSDYAAGRYNLARQSFTEYLKQFPTSEVADNAQYWIGECAYATGDFNGAIDAFKKVVANYPNGDKVSAALLKTGISYARLKNMDEAKKYYREVITKYPKSDDARIARERLNQR